MSGVVARLGRLALWPLRRILDPRFADLGRRIDYARDRVLAETETVEDRVSAFGAAATESMTFMGQQLRAYEATLQGVQDAIGPVMYAQRIDALVRGPVEGLDPDTSRLLGHAEGHAGFAAQRNLWLNPPLTLEYAEGDVRLGSVNERIVEVPFAFRALGDLGPGAAVLDVGSVESTVPLSLAAMGYRVTALDLRPYPFAHPNLEVAVARIEEFERAPASYDAALCISTVEHIGLGWYGEAVQDDGADRAALRRLAELVKPGGRLVLTVPFGRAAVDAVQRTYDDAGLDALLAGWEVQERAVVSQRDEHTWVPGRAQAPDARSVALVLARRPAA
jgi:SAM-dependent methyltransferase